MNNKILLLEEALSNNEISDFIKGNTKKYHLVCPYADMPTDPDQVFDAIKEYYLKSSDLTIWDLFEYEMVKLTNEAEGLWLSIYYLSMYLSYRKHTGKDFIKLSNVLSAIEKSLNKFKSVLMENRRWVGIDFEDGLWGDLKRLINILIRKFNININLGQI